MVEWNVQLPFVVALCYISPVPSEIVSPKLSLSPANAQKWSTLSVLDFSNRSKHATTVFLKKTRMDEEPYTCLYFRLKRYHVVNLSKLLTMASHYTRNHKEGRRIRLSCVYGVVDLEHLKDAVHSRCQCGLKIVEKCLQIGLNISESGSAVAVWAYWKAHGTSERLGGPKFAISWASRLERGYFQ